MASKFSWVSAKDIKKIPMVDNLKYIERLLGKIADLKKSSCINDIARIKTSIIFNKVMEKREE